MNRRSLITGLISLTSAPAIVRISNIMPIKAHDLSFQEWMYDNGYVTPVFVEGINFSHGYFDFDEMAKSPLPRMHFDVR